MAVWRARSSAMAIWSHESSGPRRDQVKWNEAEAANAATLDLFVLGFLLIDIAQPIAGALFALVGIALALRFPRVELERHRRSDSAQDRGGSREAAATKDPAMQGFESG
jgi:hypothetical protein